MISPTISHMASGPSRLGIAAVITAALCMGPLIPVNADDQPRPSASLNSNNVKEKFKYDQNSYKAAMKAREEAREQINEIFKAAMKKAKTEAKAAMAKAKTAEQKLIIMNNLKNARATAVAVRDAALAALGSLPTPPLEQEKDSKRRTLSP
jgi:hypothetical protein